MKFLRLPDAREFYAFYTVISLLVVAGALPRFFILMMFAIAALWCVTRPIEDGVLFFVESIPLLIALPLTTSYDNLTMWRPLAIIIGARFFLVRDQHEHILASLRSLLATPLRWAKERPIGCMMFALLCLALLSLTVSSHPIEGIKRIIYFSNLTIVPYVLYALLRQERITNERVIWSIIKPVILVVIVGFAQLLSTYLIDVYAFMRFWGEGIEARLFGAQWSYIAVHIGNTWLAYYGDQLSLRMFSLFPDSHSFPTFVLLGMPALLAVGARPILIAAQRSRLLQLYRTYASLWIVAVPISFLAVIASGTRGIWLSAVGVVALLPLYRYAFAIHRIDVLRRRMFAYGASFLATFFLLFFVAWPIFTSPQFLVGKSDLNLFGRRLSSTLDFGETSNALRIVIWKSTLESIYSHPLLGIGIGNFPVILHQNITLAKAGSTAHNLYLHVAAEMGIAAALITIALFGNSLYAAWRWFRVSSGISILYSGSLLLYLPWIYAYVLTDPILFDERVYLLFASTLAIIWSQSLNEHA